MCRYGCRHQDLWHNELWLFAHIPSSAYGLWYVIRLPLFRAWWQTVFTCIFTFCSVLRIAIRNGIPVVRQCAMERDFTTPTRLVLTFRFLWGYWRVWASWFRTWIRLRASPWLPRSWIWPQNWRIIDTCRIYPPAPKNTNGDTVADGYRTINNCTGPGGAEDEWRDYSTVGSTVCGVK